MSHRVQPSFSLLLSGTAATASAALAMSAHAVLRADGTTAEGLFLAYLACCALLGLLPGALCGARAGVSWWTAVLVLVTLAHWVLPPGSPRGGVITVLLAIAALGSLSHGFAAAERSRHAPDVGLGWVMGAAVGVQALLKTRSLLAVPGERAFSSWLLLAAVAAGLILLLARRRGAATALIAGGAAALAGDGLSGTVVLTLAVITWAVELAHRRPGALGLAVGLLPLLLPLLWDPLRGGLALLAAVALLLGRRWIPVLFVGAGLLLLVAEPRPWAETVPGLAALAITLPTLLLPGDSWRAHSLTALVLAVVGLRLLPASQGLPAPAILAAILALGPGSAGRRLRANAAWVAFLVVWRCLHSGYPWLRDGDLVAAIEALGLSLRGWLAPVSVGLLVLVFAFAAVGGRRLVLAIAIATTALLAPATWRWLGRETLVEWPPVILESGRPAWSRPLSSATSATSARLIVDSALAHSGALAAGRPVLAVHLHESASTRSWTLRVGEDTGEWAAAREGSAAPSPWIHWLDASGSFLGQRYRSVLELGVVSLDGSELEIALVPGIPTHLEATLYRVVLVRDRSIR